MKILCSHKSISHKNAEIHPEAPARIERLLTLFQNDYSAFLDMDYPNRPLSELPSIHDPDSIKTLIDLATKQSAKSPQDYITMDADTAISNGTLESLEDAFGAITTACQHVISGDHNRIFCATRPPGHHAEYDKTMGFCFIDWVYLAATMLTTHRDKKALIIDFDVHHGNGTQNLVEHHFKKSKQKAIYFASLHEAPLYPGTGEHEYSEIAPEHILNIPYPPHINSANFRALFSQKLIPYIDQIRPDIIIISAGFDAHRDDPLSTAQLDEEDYSWITTQLTAYDIPILSVLEGGYHLDALENCVTAHLDTLFNL